MARHQGTLPQECIAWLKDENTTLQEIADEAAHLRGDGKLCGTSTALILHWTRRHRLNSDRQAIKEFEALYRTAWAAERAARKAGASSRPADRPVVGGRSRPRSHRRERMGFVAAA